MSSNVETKETCERLTIVMDENEPTMDWPLKRMVEEEGVGRKEFSYKYWGRRPPNTFLKG